MGEFRISTHGRLKDWVAVEKGYFDDEGLDYELDVKAQENADQDVESDGQQDVRTGDREIPERFHDMIDVRRFGPGERIVFLPYTADAYERTQRWMRERELFEGAQAPPAYDSVVHVRAPRPRMSRRRPCVTVLRAPA